MHMEKRRIYGTRPWSVLLDRDWRKEEDSAKQIEESMARKKSGTVWYHKTKIRKSSKREGTI